MGTLDKIEDFLNKEPVVDAEMDDDIFERMIDFVTKLEPEQVSDEQADEIMEFIDYFADDEDEISEEEEKEVSELARRKVRIDPTVRRKRRKEHRRMRAKKKRLMKKYRRSAKGKLMLRKAKRMGKRGRTSTGKRQRTFIGARG